MSEVRLSAEPRTEFGKGAARRTRRAQKVPAVLYGHGTEPRHLSLPGHELFLALKGGSNTLLRLDLGNGDSQLALAKDVQRDPIKGFLEHVDLVAVRKGERVTVEIPVQLTGEAGADTLVDQQTLTLTVTADATALPEHLELDIAGKAAGDSLTAGDVRLPAGTELAQHAEHVIVAFLGVQSEEQLEADLASSEEELGAGAAGAAAAGDDVEVGSENEATGEGDLVGETEAPYSETPAQ